MFNIIRNLYVDQLQGWKRLKGCTITQDFQFDFEDSTGTWSKASWSKWEKKSFVSQFRPILSGYSSEEYSYLAAGVN